MGMRTDPRGKSRPLTIKTTVPLLTTAAFYFFINTAYCFQDAVHITAILGESVVFNCHVEFPEGQPVPYVLQWEKKGQDIPIYIWYESYPTHSGVGYEGRVSRVSPDSNYGAASLNLTNIRVSDQGWYECKVVFLNRFPNSQKNGTWFHLDVHAPPRFLVTPEEVIYVNLGDAIILNCQAEGTPTPEILWYKDANPIETNSGANSNSNSVTTGIGIFNDGTELRFSNIRSEDIGDYTCIARNGEGQISHTARVIIAGGAVIMVPPTNQTKLEGEKVQFNCEAKALPGNVTVKWFREGAPVKEVASLETRVTIRRDGSLVVNPVSADDSGQYLCEVSNGIGEPQSASAYLNVEYPAKVTFTPTVQYLPFRLAGVVQCYIKANPPLQYVTWTKDKRLLEPYQTKDIVIMNNGSLLFTRVNQNHQGRYTCTPYNAQGTQGSSGQMEVLVRKPPVFTIEPEAMYQKKVGETVEMHCDAQEAEGTQKPTIQWQRRDSTPLQKNRVRTNGGNITIESLRRSDFGFYQCVASNEVATIVTTTQLVVEGTQPHAPYNLTGTATEFAVTLNWLPGYSGGPDYKQDYTIWYREAGVSEWSTIPVTPSGSTQVTINRLAPATTYEFQIVGKNALGDGMMSKIITIRTLEVGLPPKTQATPAPFLPPPDDSADIFDYSIVMIPSDLPPILRPKGPKPGPPRNLTVTEISNGFLISWQPPLEKANLIQHYTIKYRTDGPWKTLNKGQIRPEDTQYLVKNLVGGRTYYFRVLAYSLKNFEASDEVKFPVPARVKHKAITAGVVGGILFFIVAIILSVCAVKICNKRKRRKQEKAYNMVACRITDSRNGGNASESQVPLKKLRKGGIPGISVLAFVANWVWPRDRCRSGSSLSWHPDYLHPSSPSKHKSLGRISRAADGRFVLIDSSLSIRAESLSNVSSSDDGGFLPKRTNNRASWRKPLVSYPSQLSLRSDASGQSARPVWTGLLGTVTGPRYYNNPNFKPIPTIYTPNTPRVQCSSPAPSSALLLSPWTPLYFSDLSSVRYPSSGERSYPTPPGFVQLRSMHERYSQELPSLRAIHEESQCFIPVHPIRDSPRIRVPPSYPLSRSRARLLPRHARIARSAPELGSPDHLDRSPESRSSSSGFGSKNTSSQQNQSSQSGSTFEWKLPPYRPPPPPYALPPPPPLVGHWQELASSSPSTSEQIHKAVDVGSVDGHYEFDPSTPTPTPSTPTGPRDTDLDVPPLRKSYGTIRSTRYDNIDARVQAMKEEFNEFRKRQAKRRRSHELESAC